MGYKKAAARVLTELENSLGHDLDQFEKFMFVYGTTDCKLPEDQDQFDKSVSRCRERKAVAERAMEVENWNYALECLNEAICLAPCKEDPETGCTLADLASALFMRSQVLVELKDYDTASRDASLAGIKGGYPEEKLYQLYQQQAHCQELTKQFFEAQKSYNRAMSALDRSNLSTEQQSIEKAKIQASLSSISKRKDTKAIKLKKTEELAVNKKHQKYPSLSRSVSIQYSQEKGRYAVAGDDIKIGDVIGVDEPVTFCLHRDQMKTRCLHCFVVVVAGLPCPTCAQVVFCSLTCRGEATTTYHRYECRNYHLLEPGPNFMALRAVTSKCLAYFLDKRIECFTNYDESKGSELEGSKIYKSLDLKNFFNLATNAMSLEKTMENYMVAAYLLKILQKMDFFEDLMEKKSENNLNEEEVYIGTLLAHFVQVVESNSHLICQLSGEHTNMRSLQDLLKTNFCPEEIGCGVNATLAFFNHSCNPNSIKIQQGNKTVLIATKNIKKGEDIFDNYGTLFYTTNAPKRKEELNFDCNCEACSKRWPKYRKLSDKLNIADMTSQTAAAASLERGRAANALMQKITSELSLAHYGKVLALCMDYRRTLDKIITPPHRFYFNSLIISLYCYWVKHGNRAPEIS